MAGNLCKLPCSHLWLPSRFRSETWVRGIYHMQTMLHQHLPPHNFPRMLKILFVGTLETLFQRANLIGELRRLQRLMGAFQELKCEIINKTAMGRFTCRFFGPAHQQNRIKNFTRTRRFLLIRFAFWRPSSFNLEKNISQGRNTGKPEFRPIALLRLYYQTVTLRVHTGLQLIWSARRENNILHYYGTKKAGAHNILRDK